MSVGSASRNAFSNLVRLHGSTFVVFKNHGTPNETSTELKGFKASRNNRPNAVRFHFLDDPGVAEGDVIKLKASSQLWRVENKGETIANDIIITHDVDVVENKVVSEIPTPTEIGHSVVVNGPVHGGIQIQSPHATQMNFTQTTVSSIVRDLKQLFHASSLSELDKEEAIHALDRVGELCAKPKSPEVLAKVAEKIDDLTKIASGMGAIAVTAMPLLEKVYRLIVN